jgi:hypothetical protein
MEESIALFREIDDKSGLDETFFWHALVTFLRGVENVPQSPKITLQHSRHHLY